MIAIAIGSNVEPEENSRKGLLMLSERVEVYALSRFYRTPAVGPPGQPPFLNGVCAIRTDVAPAALKFDILRPIEEACGRTRTENRYAPRCLDLDILIYHDVVIQQPGLVIPDPEILDRAFLWKPLLELDHAMLIPGMDDTLFNLTRELESTYLELDGAATRSMRGALFGPGE